MYFINLFLMFITFSFLGWLIETVYCSLKEKRFIYRGFLHGPICPIYGFGALAVGIPLSYIKINPILDFFLVYIAGVVICSLVEYLIGFIFEKFFNLKLWDYSNYKYNLHGRIWLGYSLGWGALSLILVYLINPLMTNFIDFIPYNIKVILTVFLGAALAVDLIFTILNVTDIAKKLGELKNIFTKLQLRFKTASEQGADFSFFESKSDDEIENYKKIANKLGKHRIIRSFPGFTIKKFTEQLKIIKNRFKSNKKRKDN
ncbi:MAG TPA: putative ABC transporter permease [Clostridia bacterium]